MKREWSRASGCCDPMKPFEAHGLWWAVCWPHVGRGSSPRAAQVDLALRRLLWRRKGAE